MASQTDPPEPVYLYPLKNPLTIKRGDPNEGTYAMWMPACRVVDTYASKDHPYFEFKQKGTWTPLYEPQNRVLCFLRDAGILHITSKTLTKTAPALLHRLVNFTPKGPRVDYTEMKEPPSLGALIRSSENEATYIDIVKNREGVHKACVSDLRRLSSSPSTPEESKNPEDIWDHVPLSYDAFLWMIVYDVPIPIGLVLSFKKKSLDTIRLCVPQPDLFPFQKIEKWCTK